MTIFSLAIETAIKSTLILVLTFAAANILRRASASIRHMVWITALAAALALPWLSAVTPGWTAMRPPSKSQRVYITEVASPTAQTPTISTPPNPEPIRWQPWVLALWAGGALAVLARLGIGSVKRAQLARDAARMDLPQLLSELTSKIGVNRYVRLLESGPGAMPMTWGLFRPVILLPKSAGEWPSDRLRTVLAHELVHVRRFDYLTQLLSQFACCLYWFNPLIWLASAELRKERERACDDEVLRLGTKASSYAGHLVDLARSLQSAQSHWSAEIAMATPSHLESRLAALWDSRRNRQRVSRAYAVLTAVAAACLIIPLAALKAPAQSAKGTISGTVYDPSGGAVPRATIAVSNLDTHTEETGITNEAGEYQFPFIPAGHYNLEVRKAGFKIFHKDGVALEQAADLHFDPKLDIGAVNENIEVIGTSPSRQQPRSAATDNVAASVDRVRVGEGSSSEINRSVIAVAQQKAVDHAFAVSSGEVALRVDPAADG